MRPPLLPTVVLAALSYAGHVQPRFMDDPELGALAPRRAWTRTAPGAAAGCQCAAGVMPNGGLRLQAVTAGNVACCEPTRKDTCLPRTTAVARRRSAGAPLPSPVAAVSAAAARRAAAAPRVATAPRRGDGMRRGGRVPGSRASALGVSTPGASGLAAGTVHAAALGARPAPVNHALAQRLPRAKEPHPCVVGGDA